MERYTAAVKHLKKCPTLGPHVTRHGPCTLQAKSDDPFIMLVRCVVSQQLSTKAANTIYAKLETAVKRMTPKNLLATNEDVIRAAGISGAKQRSLRAIAEHVLADKRFLKSLPDLNDEDFRAAVTAIKGIGPWSADMLLMFGYGRMDVWPTGDFGVKAALKDIFELNEYPTVAEMMKLAEPWRPYRSIAAWYLWRTRDNKI